MNGERCAIVNAFKRLATSATADPAFGGAAGDPASLRGTPEGWSRLAAHSAFRRHHVTRT
jgi:hypothetical protein